LPAGPAVFAAMRAVGAPTSQTIGYAVGRVPDRLHDSRPCRRIGARTTTAKPTSIDCAHSYADHCRKSRIQDLGSRPYAFRDMNVLTRGGTVMSYTVDFDAVSTVGLESSPAAVALAGLRANEARYFKNKYDHTFTVEPASDAESTIAWVSRILEEERGIVISSRPLEATAFQVENLRMAYVFYENGLSINVMYAIDEGGKRAVGFKLSDGMDIPVELRSFKFARQKSKLAGTIRGSYFVIKKEH
jgi:hypothetical protein